MSSVSGNEGAPREGGDARLLAPWYVTGQLEEAERREIEKLAQEDPEFARLLEEAAREAEATVSLNEALGGPSPEVWRRLEQTIAQENRAASGGQAQHWLRGALHSTAEFLASLTGPNLKYAAAAVLALCVVQAGAIVYLMQKSSAPASYWAASGPRNGHKPAPAAFIVEFSDGAAMGEIGQVLADAGATIVEGPMSGAVYRVGLRNDTPAARDEALQKLRSSKVVKLVLPQKRP